VADFNTCAKPEWPKSSLRNEETGTVTLQFLIAEDGRVADSKIVKSSGFRDLDKAAQVGISKCRFKPGTVDGKPEQAWMQMQYVWTLE
jgi:protein TonB